MSQPFSIDLDLSSANITPVASGQLAIIDPTVEEYQMLAAGVVPGTEVVILDSNRDGVEQITEILRNSRNLEALHIVSHGSPGTLYLGSTQLSLETLNRYKSQLQQWDVGNIFLYGCNVAAEERGSQFVAQFAQWTGGAVAASKNRVGSQHLGANWQLEATFNETHPIQMALAFDATTLQQYAGAFAPTITNLTDSTYNEQDPAMVLDGDITFSGGTNYQGGYLDFSLGAGTADESLTLLSETSPATGLNQLSIVGNNIYLGNGTNAAVIGSVDSTLNGQNGQSLRINFSNGFENGDFDNGAPGDTNIPGWTVVNQQIKFGTDTIAGLPTPNDTTIPASAPNADQNTASVPGTMTTVLDATQNDGFGNSLRLTSTGITTLEGFDIVRGPAIYSDGTVSLLPGDQVSFEWQAQGGGDAYDVYGYLIDVNTNDIVTILDQTGDSATATTTWATETVTITQEGQYKFVFVSGTYDFTGLKGAGAQLFIDDVTVTQAVPPPAVLDDTLLSSLAQRVQYNNASDTPPASQTLTISVQNNAVETTTGTALININRVNDQPSFTATNPPEINEDAGVQTLNTWAAFNPGPTDEAAETATYLISNISDPTLFSVAPAVDASGNLTYTPAPDAFGTSTFDVVVQDSGGTANGGIDTSAPQTFTITINGINDAPSFTNAGNQTLSAGSNTAQTIANWASGFNFGSNETTQAVDDFIVTVTSGAGLFTIAPDIANDGTLTFTPNGTLGTATVQVQLRDNGGTANGGIDTSDIATFDITIANTPPVVDSAIPDNSATSGEAFSFTLPDTTFSDADGDELTLTATLENGDPLPDWLTFDPATGAFSGSPTDGDIGSLNITVTANDGTTSVGDTFTLTVGEVPNTPPVVDSAIPDNSATSGEAFSFTLPGTTFSDADGDELTLTATLENGDPLPDWLTFDPATGAFSGSPTDGDIGALTIQITATDPSNATISTTFNLEISEAPDPNIGTPGDDTIDGGEGNDTIDGGEGEDTLSGGDGDDTIDGGNGNDTIDGGESNDILDGGDGEDSLSGGNGNDTIDGGEGNDILDGGEGDDSLSGGNGDDTLIGGGGADTLLGGDGNDTYILDALTAAGTVINDASGTDSLLLNNATLSLTPTPGANSLLRDGNNLVIDLDGDGIYNPELDLTVVNFFSPTGELPGTGFLESIGTLSGAEILAQLGNQTPPIDSPPILVPLGPTGPTAFADFIAGLPDLGQQLTSPITDIDCNCPPMPAAPMVSLAITPTIPVTEGDDILIGSDFGDAMTGFGGNDVIYGFGGDDLIVGDSGNDLLFGATGNDIIAGSTGDDVIYAGQGNDLVYAGQDNDFVYGDLGNDTLLGDKGNDIIFGGTSDLSLADLDGNDVIYGGEGDDQLHGNVGNDSLSGGVGDDLLRGGQNDDLLHGDEGNDILWGDKGNDILCGGDGNDTLYGGNGSESPSTESDNDYLCGGNGEDWLIGGLGENTLIGGAGSDRFILHHNGGTDLILDFTDGVDLIGLSQGLSFENLAITQGDVGTLITVDNQLLATLNNVNASTITADDFFSFA
jgi:Ca2+-binding RTX toxin-like protein